MNEFFDEWWAAASGHGGEVLTFMGYALLAIFLIADGEGEKVAAAIEATQLALDWIEVLNGPACVARSVSFLACIWVDVIYGNAGIAE